MIDRNGNQIEPGAFVRFDAYIFPGGGHEPHDGTFEGIVEKTTEHSARIRCLDEEFVELMTEALAEFGGQTVLPSRYEFEQDSSDIEVVR